MEGSLGRKRTWFYCLLPKGQPLVGCPCPWVTLEISARGGAVILVCRWENWGFGSLTKASGIIALSRRASTCGLSLPYTRMFLPSLSAPVLAGPVLRSPYPVTCQMCLLPPGNQPRPGLVTWWDLGHFYLPCSSHPPCLCVLTLKDEFFHVPVLFLSGFLAVRIVGLGRRWLGL